MSYILEALKKADADRERERSAVPSLLAHTDALGFEREPRGGAALAVKLAAAAALLLAGGGAAWWWTTSPSTPDERPIASAAPAPAAMPIAAPSPPPSPSPAPAPAPAPSPAITPSPASPPAATAPPRTRAAPPAPARKAVPPAAAAPAAAEPRLPTRNELGPELRAALPPLDVSGAVYAPASSGRLLFVNGLVLREGDAVSDGLTVERIGRASSVLAFRGQRFELKH